MAFEHAGLDTSTTLPTLLTCHATPLTQLASYVELLASTARESHTLRVVLNGVSTSNKRAFRFYIATGAASSEVDLLEFTTYIDSGNQATEFEIPVTIGSGERVSVNVISSHASSQISIGLTLTDSELMGTSSSREVTDSGTIATRGPTVSGSTINTKASWVELIASTSIQYDKVLICVGAAGDGSKSTTDFLVDIGVGAASSEVVTIPDLYVYTTTAELVNPKYFLVDCNIASGSRIAARLQCSGTSNDDLDILIVGMAVTTSGGDGGTDSVFGR